THAAVPARVSAPGHVRGGVAQDAGRQGQPQGAARHGGERRGAHACPVSRRSFPGSPTRRWTTCPAASVSRSPTRSSAGATRPARRSTRPYAHGIGDDNPLWCDPAYAAGTRWGGVVAPPSFLFATSRIISGYVGGLPGVHAMWAGADWTWHLPVHRNDAI